MSATRRGRPRGFDREAALAAATRLFWRQGYAATSIADLCAAMGIASPSLYAAFGSKEALYEEALRHYVAAYAPRIWSGFAAAPTAREAVEALLLDSARVLPSDRSGKEPGGCMVTLAAVAGEGCERLGRIVLESRAEGLNLLRDRLARGQEAGEIAAGVDVEAAARLWLAVQQGLSVQARDGAGPAALEAVARAAMRGWDGLMGAAPGTGTRTEGDAATPAA
ncbi:TetR/AcrR family transcriptional regulator [Roseomonas sp. NAR14]|uniref:TetR/AcrR family transcriptional regulator n=1 Tax=Roseomonas acroporae TaxID=2937791 RepID=A0A9X1YA50_9PROT|nr:TetR/AcrR family transcriptional regulator [Roseomonas acroporae]MCK8785633.1 TetR/AcrR family transcriptional regulator [Roseomonas acroporae]